MDTLFTDIVKAVISGLVVSGLLGLVLVISNKNKTSKKNGKTAKKSSDILKVVLTFVIVALLVLVLLLVTACEVTITDPANGSVVPQSCEISGTITGDIPAGEYFWVFVNPKSTPGVYWPQDKAISCWNGAWSAMANIGNASSEGIFYVYIIALNEEGNQNIIDYQNKGSSTGDYPGMDLPKKAKKMTRITVVRSKN